MDRRGYRLHRCEGAGVSEVAIRGMLSISSGDSVGVSQKMAGIAAVPADARRAGYVRAVDFLRVCGVAQAGAQRSADYTRLCTARFPELSGGRAGAARREPAA